MTNFGEGITTLAHRRVVVLPNEGDYSTLRAILRAGIEATDLGIENTDDFHVASDFANIGKKLIDILDSVS